MAWSKIYFRCRFWLQKKTAYFQKQTQNIFFLINHKDAPFPHKTVLYDQAIRSLLFWGSLVSCGLLIVVLLVNALFWQGYKKRQDLIPVMAAAKDLDASLTLESKDLKQVFIPQQFLPEGSSGAVEDFSGKVLLFPLKAQEVILHKHVQPDVHPDSVSTSFEEHYAMTLDQDWFSSVFPQIYKNDWVDILVYKPFAEQQDSEVLIQKARVLHVEKSRGSSALTLNLTHAQSQALFFAHSLKMPLQIVVHSASSSF